MMQIEDNGKGLENPIDLAALSGEKHFGLIGIGERVSLLGGTMKVESPVLGGMRMLIEIPSPYPATMA
jgi:signal transduction histidine kinase